MYLSPETKEFITKLHIPPRSPPPSWPNIMGAAAGRDCWHRKTDHLTETRLPCRKQKKIKLYRRKVFLSILLR